MTISADTVREFVEKVLLDPGRDVPVVGITTDTWTGRTWLDAQSLGLALADAARVVILETGEATWELAEHLPERLEVYGGGVRIWWPRLTPQSDPNDHPLFFPRSELRGKEVSESIRRILLPRERSAPLAASSPGSAWTRFARHYRVRDVLVGTVQNITDFGIFVDVIPHVSGLVHKSQIDFEFVSDPRQWASVGDRVKVRILKLDVRQQRMELSIRQAHGAEVRAPLDDAMPIDVPPRQGDEEGAALDLLRDELETVRQDRSQLRRALAETRKQLRIALQQVAKGEGETGATDSAPAFLEAVRVAYARMLPEGQRWDWPLRRMTVGPEFLERLRSLQGIKLGKVLDVCAQVACGVVREVSGRQAHRLRTGERGAGYRTRAVDGAAAWRCSLEDGTAAARRLHWWSTPGPDGESIEFASVGVHDDYDIPV